jgi:glycosyltransferase involved in cell wall biosynthesis
VKYLFIHQNFPGQYLHVIRHLIARKGNEIAFITEPNRNYIAGVRRLNYQVTPPPQDTTHPHIRDLNVAMMRAENVARVGRNLQRLGFRPDIIIGHHGWGELLHLCDVWPGVPILGYFEFWYQTTGQDVGFDPEFPLSEDQHPRIRAMNAINLLALSLNQHGQTPTAWQKSLYPDWAQRQIRLLKEGVHLDICAPDPRLRKEPLGVNGFMIAPGDRLVTYVARNLEPYRGFHVMMRALPALLKARPDVKVVMVGGDEVSYGARLANSTWREHFQRELAGKYDAARVLMPGQVPYDVHIRLLQRSDAHVYLTYPFVPSWSLREALACGCAVIGADVAPVREFVTDRQTGLLTPCLDPRLLGERILEVLEDDKLARRIRAGARKFAEAELDMKDHLAGFDALVGQIVGERAAQGAPPRPRARRTKAA